MGLELQQMEVLSLMGYPVILEIKTMNMIYQRQKNWLMSTKKNITKVHQ